MKSIDPSNITTRSQGISFTRVGVNLGVEVHDVDLRAPLTDAQFQAIDAALVEHEVLIFRDQNISSDEFMSLGRQFGELTVHPFTPNQSETPELIEFKNDENSAPFGTDEWHSDETFRKEPPMATILRAKVVPAVGGDTVYASMTTAFDRLSPRMQDFISGLEAVHDIKLFRALFGESKEDRLKLQEYERRFPPPTHPVVRVHPISGRKVLFVNPLFTIRIKDMDEQESRSLLDTLFRQARVPEYQLRVSWRPNTVVLWDNRSVQHYAVHDYYPQRRHMERVTIRGGPVIGVSDENPREVRRRKFDTSPGVDPYGGLRAER